MTRSPGLGAAAAALALLLAGCAAPGSGSETTDGTRSAPVGSAGSQPGEPGPSGPAAGEAVPSGGGPSEPVELAAGIDVPWGLAILPDGAALVAERDSARILRVAPDGGDPVEVAVVPDVAAAGEGGLLGLAVSPDYEQDRWVYAYLTTDDDNRIIRFRLVAGSTEPADTEVVLAGIDKAGIHNGGRIGFGPDGLLYAGTGDAGSPDVSQDPLDLNGKILRMTATGEPAPGNPDPGSHVYSTGHRNVQGLAWDSRGRLWATEFGQNTLDEVNLIVAGGNYGWPLVEGEGDTDDGRLTNPQVTWPTSEASPSGAAIVSTSDGERLYVAALRGQRLWQVPLTADGAGEPVALLMRTYGRLRTVAAGPDGALWLTTSNTDGYGEARDRDDRLIRFATPPT